jgi:glutamate--cysteine ligase
MMQRTATVQVNYDYDSEADAMRKLVVALKLSPLVHAMLANSPFREGKTTGSLSERGDVWLRMDPTRSGLIPQLWDTPSPRYDDYVEWSLDAGMFLIWRDGEAIRNTGQTFRDFLAHGYQGHRATVSDFRLHLSTLFPEIRLKNTLEVRPLDALPMDLSISALAVWTGILYDQTALEEAAELCAPLDYATVERARPELTRRGLAANVLAGRQSWNLGEQIIEISRRGLLGRARGEEVYLAPLIELVEARKTPADVLIERVHGGESVLDATEIDLD